VVELELLRLAEAEAVRQAHQQAQRHRLVAVGERAEEGLHGSRQSTDAPGAEARGRRAVRV
jgi:hypothetical protein